jgi:metal-sulfur cluster biosynthetic enzyme
MNEETAPSEPISARESTPTAGEPAWSADQIREILRGVFDPELHMNIVDLGLIYDVTLEQAKANVKMTLTSPGCPYGPFLIHQVKDTVQSLKGIQEVQVEVVWDPPWGPDKMTEEARLELGFDL